MKKLYILTLIVLCSVFNASASHLMGGQITCQQLTGNSYEVKLTLYRDSIGIPMASNLTLKLTHVASTSFTNFTLIHTGAVNFLNGVEEYTFAGVVTMAPNASYMISVSHCCRNAAILNMAMPSSESLFLNTIIYTDSIANSTPVFLNPPVTLAQRNMLYQYNPLPFDADGDSLAWSMTTPLDTDLSNPVAGYLPPYADPGNAFTLDAVTGEITWIPNTVGNFVASFLVEEFRGGAKIGEIRRDMQIIVLPDSTNPNRAVFNTTPFNTTAQGKLFINAPIGQPTNITVMATDADNDLLQLRMNGEPFAVNTNPAVFNATNGAGTAYISFHWTPTQAQYRLNPYYVALRATELHGPYAFTSDLTFAINVGGVLSTNNISATNSLGQTYPNPVKGSMHIPFTLENASHVNIELINMNGQVVSRLLDQQMPTGNNHFIANLPELSKGIYMLSFRAGNNAPLMQRIVISE